MDIDALRSFIAFVDTGSFTRAAKQTFRTQSAISMQMKKLEEETGHTLFVKEGRNLSLSEQGQQLVSYARRIIALHDEAIGNFSQSHNHPPLVIGCPDDYAESILPLLSNLIREALPEQNLRICCDSSSKLRLMLDAGDVHAAILTRAPEAEEGYLLKHDTGVWVHGGFPELAHLKPVPLVLYEPDCKFHSTAIDGMEKQGLNYRLACSSSSATAIKSLVKQGLGISAMATSSVTEGLEVIDDVELPALPSVDIVLATAPVPHPMFGSALAASLSKQFFDTQNN
ncbi:LysR family transcriptional regulator [Neptuniibacter caesariensis]|uniref:Transcriptional regulator n=1 Tax=Neptuniibacter caesariensis TaxID=207954 RepID=A0A7U8C5N9_NEPCE|nr:LysR family transcriptional regulator [Neptuniibacter caesariensis]EAR61739.1 Transcriptional regulator [Neptuniibacter caesariensis]